MDKGTGILIFLIVIILVLLVILLYPSDSKAGIFSPRTWTVEEVRATYNTPEKLGGFIRRQFDNLQYIGLHSPEEVIKDKGGNCKSIANFVKTILEPLGYPCKIDVDIRATGYGRSHTICAVKDGNKIWVFSGVEYRRGR